MPKAPAKTGDVKTDNRVQFRLDADMLDWLNARSAAARVEPSLTAAVQRELCLWRDAQRLEQTRTRWTPAELGCIADVFSGYLPAPANGLIIAMELADAFADVPGQYGQKWGIDEAQLIAKAQGLSVTADAATITAIVAWWEDDRRGPHDDPDTWRALGFRIAQEAASPVAGA